MTTILYAAVAWIVFGSFGCWLLLRHFHKAEGRER